MSENYNNNWYNDDYQNDANNEEAYFYSDEKHLEKRKAGSRKPFVKMLAVIVSAAVAGSAITGAVTAFVLPGYIESKIAGAGISSQLNNKDNIYQLSSEQTEKAAENSNGALTIPQIASKVGPAAVGIVALVPQATYFGTVQGQASGSGVIMSKDGYIVTNQHVINNASEIEIYLSSGEKKKAEIVGQDARTDLAVLKMEKGEYPFAEFGDSSDVQVGDLAVAIGNPLGMEFAGSVTAGIISALNRTVEVEGRVYTLLQTDAAINSGNSGGALVDCYGKVIGINSVKIASSGVEGLGFAIPIDEAKPIISDLINHGYVKGRPVLGIMGRNITADVSRMYNYPEGVHVESTVEGSGAANAGLQRGDIITHADGIRVKTIDELNKVRDKKRAGATMTLTIERNGRIMDVNVVLGEEKNSK